MLEQSFPHNMGLEMHYNHQLHDWVLQNNTDGMSEFD